MNASPRTLSAPGVDARADPPAVARASTAGILRHCGRVARQRWWLLVLCPALVLAGTLAYLLAAPRSYVATAQLLIQPASSDDALLAALPVLHQSAAPNLEVQAETSLILSRAVARLAVSRDHLKISPTAALGYVSAVQVGQSSLVDVRAATSSASLSQRLANAFAGAAVANATAVMHAAISAQLPGLESELAQTPVAARYGPDGIGTDVDELRALLKQPNPTVVVAARADRPTAPAKPRPRSALILGLLAGLAIGVAAAFAVDALDPRLGREEQLQDVIAVPVLARLARERPRRSLPLLPSQISPASREAYRSLRARLIARTTGLHRPIVCLICSVGAGEGKSTTAINLACELARSGRSVILLEGDLRRPRIASALGLERFASIAQVLAGGVDLRAALIHASIDGCELSVLAARPTANAIAPRLSQAQVRELIAQAAANAEFVVIDSPPLDAAADALQFAHHADEVLMVARLGRSRLDRLAQAAARLSHGGARLGGLVLIGGRLAPSAYRAYWSDPQRNGPIGGADAAGVRIGAESRDLDGPPRGDR